MKRIKKFISLLTAVSISLTSASIVLAEDLSVTSKNYVAHTNSEIIGEYPEISDMSDLNSKIFKELRADVENYYYNITDEPDSRDIKISYTVVDDSESYAKVTVTFFMQYSNKDIVRTYYVDKVNNVEIATLADYEAALEAEEDEAPETDETAETEGNEEVTETDENAPEVATPSTPAANLPKELPLRDAVEALGLEVVWNQDLQLIEIVKGEDALVAFVVGVNEYIVGDEVVALSSAPVLVEGVTYVPVDFFTEVLGYVVTFNADGSYKIVEATEVVADVTDAVDEDTEENTDEEDTEEE